MIRPAAILLATSLAACAALPDDAAPRPIGATVIASEYGCGRGERLGRYTASGDRFDPRAMRAASRSLAFGTRLRVCYHGCVVVTVNDRGPWIMSRDLDLTCGAAAKIGLPGVGRLRMEVTP